MLSVKQTAVKLGVSPALVYVLCAGGVLRHSRHGRPGKRGCIRIEEAAVEEYRKACEKGGVPERPPVEKAATKPKLKLSHLTLKTT